MEIKLSLELERGQDGAGLHDLPTYEPDNLLLLDIQAVSSLLLLQALSQWKSIFLRWTSDYFLR